MYTSPIELEYTILYYLLHLVIYIVSTHFLEAEHEDPCLIN